MKNNRQFYEAFDFNRMIIGAPREIQEFLEGEIEWIRRNVCGRVLEVGCGYGRLMEVMGERPDVDVFGIDLSKKMLRENPYDASNVLLMDAAKLGFADDSFDQVLCMANSLGNMSGIEEMVVGEMRRVCKPDGRVVVSVFSENAGKVQVDNYQRIGLTGIRDEGRTICTDEGFYSRRFARKELRELFGKSGLDCEIVKISELNYIAYALKL